MELQININLGTLEQSKEEKEARKKAIKKRLDKNFGPSPDNDQHVNSFGGG